MQNLYYKRLKRQVREWVKKGMSKAEAGRVAHVCYTTVYMWTKDIKVAIGYKRVGGLALSLLTEIVSKGYAFPESKDAYGSFRVLRRYFPTVKLATYKHHSIFYAEGNERKAMEAFLKKLNLRSVSYQELGAIRQVFGIKRYRGETNVRKVLG